MHKSVRPAPPLITTIGMRTAPQADSLLEYGTLSAPNCLPSASRSMVVVTRHGSLIPPPTIVLPAPHRNCNRGRADPVLAICRQDGLRLHTGGAHFAWIIRTSTDAVKSAGQTSLPDAAACWSAVRRAGWTSVGAWFNIEQGSTPSAKAEVRSQRRASHVCSGMLGDGRSAAEPAGADQRGGAPPGGGGRPRRGPPGARR